MGYSDPSAPPPPPDYAPYPPEHPGAPGYAPDPHAAGMAPPPPYSGYPPASFPPPPAPHHARRRAVLVVAAIVGIVVIVLLLNLAGVLNLPLLPGSHSSGGGGGSPTAFSFHAAEQVGNATAQSRGGSWSLIYADGAEFSHSENYPATAPCQTFKGFVGGEESELGTGTASAWVLIYETMPVTAYSHLLIMSVFNGTAQVTVQEDPVGDCPGGAAHPGIYGLPLNASNSPWAAAVADAAGGSTFLAQYPNASASLSLDTYELDYGGLFTFRAEWSLNYVSPCTGTATGTTSSFAATLNATNASLISHVWRNATCTQSPVPTAALAFGPATVSHAGATGAETFYENLTVQANRDLSTSNFSLSVLEPNGTIVNAALIPCIPALSIVACESAVQAGGWFALVNHGSQGPVGAFPALTANSADWSMVTGAPLSLGSDVSLTIISPVSLSGDTLEGYGYGASAVPAATVTLA